MWGRRLGLLVAACGSSSSHTASTVTVTTSAKAPPAARAYLPSACLNHVERPTTFITACADAQAGVEQIKWQSWGGAAAYGSGSAFTNDCNPDCVAGGIHHSAAEIYASRLRRCGSRMVYARVAIVVANSSTASKLTGAYSVSCGGPPAGDVSSTEPEYLEEQESRQAGSDSGAEPESVVGAGALSDAEVRKALKEAEKAHRAKRERETGNR